MKLTTYRVLTTALLGVLLSTQLQAAEEKKADAKAATKAPVAAAQTPVDRVGQQELTTIQNYQLQTQNIRLQMQVLNRQLADVSAAQQAYVESVFTASQRGPEWTINTQTGAWEKKANLQTAEAIPTKEADKKGNKK